MSGNSGSMVSKLVDRVFPRMPDFFGLMNEQCDIAVEAMAEFVAFMSSGDPGRSQRVHEIEHRADTLKARNIDVLNKAFSTPIDREELYRAMIGIDHVINYAKTTVVEMELLDVKPDSYTLEMAQMLEQGAIALQRGFAKLSTDPADAEVDANAARKAERNTEKIYRKALAELLDPDLYIKSSGVQSASIKSITDLLEPYGDHAEPVAVAFTYIVETVKRREIYRHLSNASDRLARAGDVLHDIIVKIC